ncbi:hypothetical protein [Bacillus sp. AK128]
MMSLTEASLSQIIVKQYRYKWNSFFGIFSTLFITQFLGVLISLGSTSGGGTSSEFLSVNLSYFSGNIVIGFTFIWGIISAILLTTKAYRYEDFTFVTNRLSSSISNILILVTASIIGGITTILSSVLYKLIIVFVYYNSELINTPIALSELLLGMVVTTLYILLFMSVGYLIGMVGQLNKLLMFLFPPLVIFLLLRNDGDVINFFISESSFLLFFVKAVAIAFLFFATSVLIHNRMEVRT